MAKTKKIRILLTGGGTGGHIYPLVAIAKDLDRLIIEKGFNPDIRYFGDPGEYKINLELAGVKITHIASSKWRRYFSLSNFFDIFRFFLGIIQGLWKIYWFMPHACFSKGGPGSFAAVSVCHFYAIPIVLHESDAAAGLANRLAGRYARLIEIAFAETKSSFPEKTTNLVGNPVRAEVLSLMGQRSAKEEFGFDPDQKVILFLCGSQGSEKINDFILQNIKGLTEKFQVLHQTGNKNYPAYKQQADFVSRDLGPYLTARYKFYPFFQRNINAAYQAADLVVARGGAGTIFELAALAKPAILVPITESANDHQWKNAYAYSKAGAAIVTEEENLFSGLIISEVESLLKDQMKLQKMSIAAQKFYIPDSAIRIANDILNLIIPR